MNPKLKKLIVVFSVVFSVPFAALATLPLPLLPSTAFAAGLCTGTCIDNEQKQQIADKCYAKCRDHWQNPPSGSDLQQRQFACFVGCMWYRDLIGQ
ncbi:MAG: hypothetical protein M0009_02905 [Deltaproteobacteria bacterium]|nr:hypothetical protein [Deltaproteobacteria bacterium]